LQFKASLGKKFVRPPYQPIAVLGGAHLKWEAETGRIVIPGQPKQKKFVKLRINNNKKAGYGSTSLSSQQLQEA
jgi:hypothetical protein